MSNHLSLKYILFHACMNDFNIAIMFLLVTIWRNGSDQNSGRENLQEIFEDAVIHRGERSQQLNTDDKNVAIMVFRDSAEGMSRVMKAILEYEFIYAALFLSSAFDTLPTIAACRVIFPNGRASKDGPTKLGNLDSGVCFAHHLYRCEYLGRTPAEYENVDELINLVLALEYD